MEHFFQLRFAWVFPIYVNFISSLVFVSPLGLDCISLIICAVAPAWALSLVATIVHGSVTHYNLAAATFMCIYF